MNIVELVGRYPSECLALSPQQQTFIIKYITSGRDGKYDALAATKAAYPRVKNAAAWTGRLLQNKSIKRIIALHLGLTEHEVLLGDIKALIKRSKRKGANLDVLVAPWLRVAAALEAVVTKQEKSNG